MSLASKPSAVNEFVGQKVRARRTALGLNHDTVAQHLRISRQGLNEYEDGVVRIPAEHLIVLAGVLKVPLAYFFTSPTSDGQTPATVEQVEQLTAAFRDIGSDEIRQYLLHLAVKLAELDHLDVVGASTH